MDAPPVPLFDLWLPTVEAGALPLRELVAWADDQVARLPEPPLWLIETSLATDVGGLRRAALAVPEPVRGYDAREVYLGLLYLAHEPGQLSPAELLLRSGNFADGPGYGPFPSARPS